MSRLLLVLCIFAISLSASSQSVKGMWKGKMEIDSPKNTIHFEITLKEKQGKLYGYCYRLFFVNDTLYYNLVKVNARIVDSVLIIDDEKSVSNNFKFKTSGIKVSIFINLKEEKEAITHMTGEWNTSRFKQFMPLSGSVSVVRERNYKATQLYKRLEDKGLDQSMAFEEPELNEPVVAKNETPEIPGAVSVNQKQQTTIPVEEKKKVPQTIAVPTNEGKETTKPGGADNQQIAVTEHKTGTQPNAGPQKPAQNSSQPAVTLPTEEKGKETIKPGGADNQQVAVTEHKTGTQPNAGTQKPTQNSSQPTVTVPTEEKGKETIKPGGVDNQQVAVTEHKTGTQPNANNPVIKNDKEAGGPVSNISTAVPVPEQQKTQQPVMNAPVAKQEQPQQNLTKIGQGPIKDSLNIQNAGAPVGSAPVINNPTITKRATEVIQSFTIYEDSITLSLYDNGEIDGDIVSVYMNNEKIISGVRLSETAFKKTIYFQPGQLIQLTLFAENLGSIPPNTGLLVIYSGDQRYQVHFSSTLNKSAVILLRTEGSSNP